MQNTRGDWGGFRMKKQEMLNIFQEWEAILEGHFLLSSGRHSACYMQCALVLQDPKVAEKLCAELIKNITVSNIDVVIGPALGGVTLAYEVARQMGTLALFAERENGEMTLRRGFNIKPGTRVLVTEDVITTGGSVKEVIEVVKSLGAQVIGVGCLVDRSNGAADFGVPLFKLLDVDAVSYSPDDCPLCRKGLELVKPGSKK